MVHKKTQNLNLLNFLYNVKHFVVIFYHREKKTVFCFQKIHSYWMLYTVHFINFIIY